MHSLEASAALERHLRPTRLADLATRLCAIPSPTGQAGEVAELLAQVVRAEGFQVDRPSAGHPLAPAVVVRWSTGRPGRVLQFDGHLDTVHLPFVAPAVEGNRLTGSGAADMKAGVAAAFEALLAVRDSGLLAGGEVLFTAHDLHEAPWGDGSQLDELIRQGLHGEGVLIPESFSESLPIRGRGQAVLRVTISRPGPPVHEVYRPLDEPDVLAVGCELVQRLQHLGRQVGVECDPLAGAASVFVGQLHGGEIYNQFPQKCHLEGTRRWLPGTLPADVERQFRDLLRELASETGATIDAEFQLVRDAFALDPANPLVATFQAALAVQQGRPLRLSGKPFVDDGNSFWALAQVPAITHGPRAAGMHTTTEWVDLDDLLRVARVYAATALAYCPMVSPSAT